MREQPTLSQTQIIRALADALSWFEREVSWGVPPSELRALTGRIGELYAAMITRGQMALASNQRGYDIVSAEGDRISVKTITSSNHIDFKASTFGDVDRVLILRINTNPEVGVSIEELEDRRATEVPTICRITAGSYRYSPRRAVISDEGKADIPLRITASAHYDGFTLVRFENGAVRVMKDGLVQQINVKTFLRPIAAGWGISTESSSGIVLNTQQLGALVIRALQDLTPKVSG